MDNQKSRSTFSATLPALILGLMVLWTGSAAVAAEKKKVKDPSTGEMVSAPEYGGTFTWAYKENPVGSDSVIQCIMVGGTVDVVLEKLAHADWATPRDKFGF